MKAIYDGTCHACNDNIEEGDEIIKMDEEWVHAQCHRPDPENVDDRLRCLYCGDLLTPDYECPNCERPG